MEGDSSSKSNLPHLLMVSLAAQGYLNPLLRLAKCIAAKGLLVTLCSTDDIGHRISSSTANAALRPSAAATSTSSCPSSE
ncbi:hypothetical protein B296_00051485 [Ensete ventricosum]|uniref:Uncharacterized protein n=1 Tax=Ensete ventricosum TaxID=4639 RepID=A0A426Y7J4_ENSVE|nr:hypothetical protein B296_00051485 [Ensete ventricosum]